MTRISIGPHFTDELKAVSQYIRYRLGLQDAKMYYYSTDNQRLATYLNPGTWTIDGITFKFEIVDTFFDEGDYKEQITGHLEAKSHAELENFIQRATDYSDQIHLEGKVEDEGNTKILAFDYTWDFVASIKKRTVESLKLPKKTIETFMGDLERFMKPETVAWYEKFGISHSRIYLLHGPPGTGKTSLIQCAAGVLNRSIAQIHLNPKSDDRDLRRALKILPKKSVFVLEDIDCLFTDRKTDDTNNLTFSGFLNIFDGVTRLKDDMLVFITTNHLDTLDPALKRRVDYFVEFDYCTKKQIRDLVKMFNPEETEEALSDFVENTCNGIKLTPCALQKFLVQRKPLELLKESCNYIEGETLDMYK
jgi:chromosomal replication initiation ATPase DnaA